MTQRSFRASPVRSPPLLVGGFSVSACGWSLPWCAARWRWMWVSRRVPPAFVCLVGCHGGGCGWWRRVPPVVVGGGLAWGCHGGGCGWLRRVPPVLVGGGL